MVKKSLLAGLIAGGALAVSLFLSCNVYEDNGSLVDPGDPVEDVESSGGASAKGVPTISASPAVLAADGSSKSVITVQVRNDRGNPIVGGEVLFFTDAGIITATDTTDADGRATAQLTSERRNVVANVSANLRGDAAHKVKIAVEFSGVTVTASASPETIKPDGNDSSVVLAVLRDAANNPIVGEKITFAKQIAGTRIVRVDSTTNSRGEARCVIKGQTSESGDRIVVKAAGAEFVKEVNYSTQLLNIAESGENKYLSGAEHQSTFTVRYTDGEENPYADATLRVTVTAGAQLAGGAAPDTAGVVFAGDYKSDKNGNLTFSFNNPNFAGVATVYVKAFADGKSAVASKQIAFQANGIERIELSSSPDVIGTNGGKAKLTATVYDPFGNRVGGVVLSFNIISGAGGGEYLDPPTATTGADGSASAYLMAGSIPSRFKGVSIVAADYWDRRSNTVQLTIAGPPQNITVRRNISDISAGAATYGMKLSALVSDVNNNPVPDGTEVTFSSVIVGYRYYMLKARFYTDENTGERRWAADTVSVDVETEHFNAARPYRPFPLFDDINRNGLPDSGNMVEPCDGDVNFTNSSPTCAGTSGVFADYNGNGKRDFVESYLNDANKGPYNPDYYKIITISNGQTLVSSVPNPEYDIDWNGNGVADPKTALILTRTVLTKNGVAENDLTYGQSDAWRIRVRIWAECQGLVTSSPEEFILPKVDGARNWRYFE